MRTVAQKREPMGQNKMSSTRQFMFTRIPFEWVKITSSHNIRALTSPDAPDCLVNVERRIKEHYEQGLVC